MQPSSRRGFLGTLAASVGASPLHAGEFVIPETKIVRKTAPNRVVDLAHGPQLLIDDYLILKQEGISRVTHAPKRIQHPILTSSEFGTWQPFHTVLRDAETGRFRMWYNAWNERPGIATGNYLGYAESQDGIAWTAPELSFIGKTNLLMPMISHYGVSILDEGPQFPQCGERFKMAWWGRANKEEDANSGMYVAFSPDGFRWAVHQNPVLPMYPDHSDPRSALGVGDVLDVFFDPLTGRYAAFVKTHAVPGDGWLPGPKAGQSLRRLVSFSTSSDFIHWETPWRVVLPDSRDEGTLEFYAVGGTIARGGLLIGCPRMLHDDFRADPDGPPEGVGYATLVTSRDGESWERHTDTFLNRNLNPASWDHAFAWVGCQMPVGEEVFIYYGGYQQGHKINPRKERQLGLARMKRDRYVSRGAFGADPGVILTPLLNLASTTRLVINADASGGELRVQLRDPSRKVVPGYSFNDCTPVTADGLALPVSWTSSPALPRLGRQPSQLEFRLNNARLFAFEPVTA